MDKGKIIRVTAWTLVAIAAAYGAYKVVKYFIDHKDDDKTEEEEKTVEEGKKEGSFSEAKPVKKGSSGKEVGAIQSAFNNIINDMKKAKDFKKYCAIADPSGDFMKCIESKKTWYDPTLSAQEIMSCQMEVYGETGKQAAETCVKMKKRRDQVAELKPVVVSGKFDDATEKLAQVIMGSSQVTYADVRQKRKDFAAAYKYKNPYSK